jgi:hypothetical protein
MELVAQLPACLIGLDEGEVLRAAVEPPRAALSSAQQAHNAMARLLRARVGVSRSAATACYTLARRFAEEI